MLTIYLGLIGIGFIIFFISSYLDLRKTRSSKILDPVNIASSTVVPEVGPTTVSARGTPKEELQDIKQALVDKLDQKCVKLEQILEEKNRILAQLQKDLEDERSHRKEFESLQAILQQQIDDTKAQNRSLKDELERILQENLRLQAGLTMLSDTHNAGERPSEEGKIAGSQDKLQLPVSRNADDDIIPSHSKDGAQGN